jgi:hypothetical protein
VIRPSHRPWVVSPAVACLSGLKSAPRKRVRGNPPRVQIPPPPPADKAKRWPRHKVGAGVRGLGLIFGLIWLYFDRLFRCLGWTRAAHRADSPRRCESEQRRKLATTAEPVVWRRASLPTQSREWSSTMFKIEISVPSASCQCVMSACQRSLGCSAQNVRQLDRGRFCGCGVTKPRRDKIRQIVDTAGPGRPDSTGSQRTR